MTIYFYSTREKPYGCFSNFSAHGFTLDELWWPTSEHYFQAQKFVTTDAAWFEKIQTAKTPKDAAKMGRDRTHPLRKDWEQVKEEIMLRGVLQKFTTHEELQQILLQTGEEEIVENSPIDYYWGCGKDGSGQNRLGVILMQVREQLHKNHSILPRH
ncbi:NADAR family protein [Roseofilum capinflatum]|uniref:NADAR family protein n=1 Tax=Roseofilum capinflatum BLCC-M114 TaxID=3022440 RepID=A0ABT7BAI0_9CYAN|nr:NADAR family protein [Roseofilum capinflatum BLCC-M114]